MHSEHSEFQTRRGLGRVVAVLVLACLATGCVSAQQKFVVFPTQGQQSEQIATDRLECEAFAKANRNNNEFLQAAGFGALYGAGAGALNGAVQGAYTRIGAGQGAGIGAGAGAAMGLAVGALAGVIADHQRYLRVYAMCMQLRGYALTG